MRDHRTPQPANPIVQALTSAIGAGVMLHGWDGAATFCNAQAASLLGLSQEASLEGALHEVLDHAIREDGAAFPPDDFPPTIVARTGAPVREAIMGIQRPSGALSWILVHSAAVLEPGPDGVSVATTFHDVTHLALLEELVALQVAIATLPVGVVVGESPRCGGPRILACNSQFREMVGLSPPEGATANAAGYRIFEPDRRTEVAPEEWPGRKAARLRQPVPGVELHVLRADGAWRVLEVSAAPVRTAAQGRAPAAVVVAVDVSGRRPAR